MTRHPVMRSWTLMSIPGKVARFGDSDKAKNKFGWPKVTALVALGGDQGRWITLPEEAPGRRSPG